MILIIGGAGYIGSNVVNELLKQHQNLVVIDNLSTGFKGSIPNNVKFYKGSVEDKNFLIKVFKQHDFKVVIHLAAKLLVGESVLKPLEYFQNNVGGLINLLSVMKDFKIKNLIFSSTAAVYGMPIKQKPLFETDNTNPINPYGSSKLSCEYLIQAAAKAYGLNYVIFRYFNVAGANLDAKIGQSVSKPLSHLIPILINGLLTKIPLLVYGNKYPTSDKTCVRDYIHVTDLAQAHILGLNYVLKNHSNIFNLGIGHGYSINEVIQIASKALGVKVPFKYVAAREGDPAYLVANSDKAYKLLGFKPRYDLTDMIKSEYQWRQLKKY